jgi:hypothetical protein
MEARKTPKFWVAVQPSIIRLYKAAGLVALTAILMGLLWFLVVNIFYFFNHTWVRPRVFKENDPKVVEATTAVADAQMRQSQLEAEKLEVAAQLKELDRTVAADRTFLAEIGTADDHPNTPDQWLVHRAAEQAKLEMDNQLEHKPALEAREASLLQRIKDQEGVVHRLQQSPYLKAANGTIVLAFVPLQNLDNMKKGTKLYACRLGLVMCHPVGRVKDSLEGEVQDTHPHDDSIQRGIMVELELSTPSAANETVLFLGGKPLWLF